MSEPPNTPTSSIILHHQQYLRQQQQQPFISPTITLIPSPSPSPSTSIIREYRKGNWTLHETLVLITAKKLDDERRTKASTTPPDPTNPNNNKNNQQQLSSTRTAELRWKWVENYCWNNGCLRSQNQCNDKWDNLLRDYKKVREYEARSTNAAGPNDQLQSYWKLEKHERKERNLPTNLVSDVFEALNEVVHRRYSSTNTPKSTPSSSSNAGNDTPIKVLSPATAPPLLPPPPPSQQQQPPPPQLPPPPPPPQTVSAETATDSSETDQSERVDSETKRRRKAKSVGSSILKSASVLAQTLMNCEEKKEKRHKDIIELEQRRLRIEEDRNEVNRQGIAGLISAVNNLSGAIQALVSDRHNSAT
ncbi:hypothetical protein AQUCO_00201378v1 [Aquilegia coerulea]|uniref:Myb-like domain-containing protein n=1 Tax=Aquilegia coerulea TaxID=218851 RepID=A0A2G5F7P3_AQUCA|nr:hypothetical protein AQUCO_00201378v1 [Aquilegia coerulea]